MSRNKRIASAKELLKLQAKFGTDHAIGQQLGVSRQAIHQYRLKFNIPALLPDYSKRNKRIFQDKKNGVPIQTISEKNRLSISQLYRILKEVE